MEEAGTYLTSGGSISGSGQISGAEMALQAVNGINAKVYSVAAGLDPVAAKTTAYGASITLTGTGAGGINTSSSAINAVSGISTYAGSIGLIADAMDIAGAINAGSATVHLENRTSAKTINVGLGSSDLGISNAELGLITAGAISIGSSTNSDGGMMVDGPISVSVPLILQTSFNGGSQIAQQQGSGNTISAPQLYARGTYVTLPENNVVGKIAGETPNGGWFTFKNAGSLIVGNVLGMNGIKTGTNGVIQLDVKGNVSQQAGAYLQAGELAVSTASITSGGVGAITLTDSANAVGILAAVVGNTTYGGQSFSFVNGGSLVVGKAGIDPVAQSNNNMLFELTGIKSYGGMVSIDANNAGLGSLQLNEDLSAGAGVVHLKAGSAGIGQTQNKVITTTGGLAITSLGNVDLNNFSAAYGHAVGVVAAKVGDASNQENHFYFKSANSLAIGNVDTLSAGNGGISIAFGAGNYSSGSPNGAVVLETLGTGTSLSQASGALLAGRAVAVKAPSGTSVMLSESNPTGVIAANVSSGNFEYTSANDLWVTNVAGANGVAGITASSATLKSTGSSKNLSSNAGITATSLTLGTSANKFVNVDLSYGSNAIGTLGVQATGNVFVNNGVNPLTVAASGIYGGKVGIKALYLDLASAGFVESSGNIDLTVNGDTSHEGGVWSGTGTSRIRSTSATGEISIQPSITDRPISLGGPTLPFVRTVAWCYPTCPSSVPRRWGLAMIMLMPTVACPQAL